MREPALLLALISGAALALAAAALLRRRQPAKDDSLRLLQAQLAQLSQQLNDRMRETATTLQHTQDSVGQRLDNATAMTGLLERKLGQLEESSKRIFALGEGLGELRDALRSPKLRGAMGELFLEDLLRQILPPAHFAVQHPFRSGEVVDAVIRAGDSLVPIDSKFPLESFLRLVALPESDTEGRKRERRAFTAAIRRHAESIARKYILPQEGTLDFALMYIPAENVYYEAILRDGSLDEPGASLHSWLLARRVIPVSPGSLYAYLQVILLGLRGLQVEEHARLIGRSLQQLGTDLGRLREEQALLGRHLRNATGAQEETERRLDKLQTRLSSLAEPSGPPPEEERRVDA